MLATWRLGLAALVALLVFFCARPLLEIFLNTLRTRLGKQILWVGDVQRHMTLYLTWIVILGVWQIELVYLLELDDNFASVLYYLLAVPVVLATFALRIVITNILLRHVDWDRESPDFDARVFVLTETIQFACLVLILIEVFYIFFASSDLASFLFGEMLLMIEVLAILSGFTVLKNVATGLFLIFAEPFRTGSLVKVQNWVGFIERVSLARTIMRRQDGSRVFIPNGVFSDYHQVNVGAQEALRHELVLFIDPKTPIERVHLMIDELVIILPDYAAPFELPPRSSAGSRESSLTPQYMVASNASRGFDSIETHGDRRMFRIGLHAMYKVKVSMIVDLASFRSVEQAKTQINMAIIDVLHRLKIRARQSAY